MEIRQALERELELLRHGYGIQLDQLAREVEDARTKLQRGVVSTHDGFNLGGKASDLQALATQIEQTEKILRAFDEKTVAPSSQV